MRKPPRALAATLTLAFLAGCMGTVPRPLPEPSDSRSRLAVRGVMLGDSIAGERIEFTRVDQVVWTDSVISITGRLKGGGDDAVTRTHPLTDVGALLVRQVDPNRTSLIIAAVIVGGIAAAAFALTGQTGDDTVL